MTPLALLLRRRHTHRNRSFQMPTTTRLSTWQGAEAFNQPLSFDTSQVTNMINLFWVRSTRARPPNLNLEFPPSVHMPLVGRPCPYTPSHALSRSHTDT